ncbi:spherical body protein, putative [Babesia ovis]|uniref:Spherical body protein, putative n=1 Tax=Babesia ovis TaxID=5869 RepID=A0A9W5T9V7_BABOV|nr:spherical body protein, putative [Babesia ovis]
MVALSLRYVLFVALFGYAKVQATAEEINEDERYALFEERVEEHPIQIHGDSEAMSLDLLMPVNQHLITKKMTGCFYSQPVHYMPVAPNKLTSVFWADQPIFEVYPQPEEPTIDEVIVRRNCYDAVVTIKVGDKVYHFSGNDDGFYEVDEEGYNTAVEELEQKSIIDIDDLHPSECLTVEKDGVFDIEWYNIHPATCYFADRFKANGHLLWKPEACPERIGGASVIVNGDEKLVALAVNNGSERKRVFFKGLNDAYQQIDEAELKELYELVKKKEEEEFAKLEAAQKAEEEAEEEVEELEEEEEIEEEEEEETTEEETETKEESETQE